MSVAADVDLDIDQGADFGMQLYWTSMDSVPFTVLAPMRMEIRDGVGNLLHSLVTNDENSPDASILYNSDSGLIQLVITAADTATFPVGAYSYDLFVTYQDNRVTNATRVHKLASGVAFVNDRVTKQI